MLDEAESFWGKYFPTALARGKRLVPGQRELLMPDALSASDIRRWILHVTKSLQMTPTQFAKIAGLAPSTINRFLKDDTSANLSARTLETLIRAHTDKILEMLMTSNPEAAVARHTISFDTIGRVDRDLKEHFEWDETCDYLCSSPIPTKMIYGIYFGFEIGLDAGYEHYKCGDVLFAVPFSVFRSQLVNDQNVLCHEKQKNGLVQSFLKKIKQGPDGDMWLVRMSEFDSSRSVYMNDLSERGFNEDFFASFLIVGSISCEEWLGWD